MRLGCCSDSAATKTSQYERDETMTNEMNNSEQGINDVRNMQTWTLESLQEQMLLQHSLDNAEMSMLREIREELAMRRQKREDDAREVAEKMQEEQRWQQKVRDTIAAETAEAVTTCEKTIARIHKTAEAYKVLRENGFNSSFWSLNYGPTIRVEKSDLPRIRSIFGSFDGKRIDKSYAGTKEEPNRIAVTVYPKYERFNDISFVYYSTLRAGGPCRIVEQTSAPYTYKTIVCQTGEK